MQNLLNLNLILQQKMNLKNNPRCVRAHMKKWRKEFCYVLCFLLCVPFFNFMSKRVRNQVQTPHFEWRTRTQVPLLRWKKTL